MSWLLFILLLIPHTAFSAENTPYAKEIAYKEECKDIVTGFVEFIMLCKVTTKYGQDCFTVSYSRSRTVPCYVYYPATDKEVDGLKLKIKQLEKQLKILQK